MARSFVSIRVIGTREVEAALAEFESSALGGVEKALLVSGKALSARAQANATAQGLAPPGTSGRSEGGLVGGIREEVKGLAVFIRDDTARDGFPYPAVYEFSKASRRPFMGPAIRDTYPELMKVLEAALNNAAAASKLAA